MRMPVVVFGTFLLAGCGSSGSTTSSIAVPVTAAPATASTTAAPTTSSPSATAPSNDDPVGTASPSASGSTSPTPAHTLRYELDHTTSCAALAADFTYISVSAISTQDGRTYVTYQPATMHCGGPDDFQYLPQPGVHHVYVDDDAEVVLVDDTPKEIDSSAKALPAGFAAHHQPIFAIRHSGTGHASALVQRFHP